MLRRVLLFLVATTLVACEEKEPITINAETGGTAAVLLITDDAAGADNTGGALTADAVLLDWQPVEPPEPELSREEICAQTPISHGDLPKIKDQRFPGDNLRSTDQRSKIKDYPGTIFGRPTKGSYLNIFDL